jgi:succinoglycan biosynthesis transport protein ExoP
MKKIVGFVRRRWPVLVLALALGLTGMQVFLSYATPIYSASVQLLIDTRKQAIERDAALSGLSLETGAIESEVALMRSVQIAKRVVQSLHLDKDLAIVAQPPESVWSDFIGKIWAAQPPLQPSAARSSVARLGAAESGVAPSSAAPPSSAAESGVAPSSPAPPSSAAESGVAPLMAAPSSTTEGMGVDPLKLLAIDKVRKATQVRRVGLTYAIEITFSSPDAVKAAKIANALAQAYLTEQLEAQFEAARRAADWLSERLVGLRVTVEQSSRAVAQYKHEHQMLETTSGGIEKEQLSELSVQLVQARMSTMEKKARYDQFRNSSEGGSFNLRSEYEVALRREQELEKTFQHAADKQASLDEMSVRLRELEREAESNSLIYQSYLQRFKEASENKSLERRETRVITPAETPSSPSYPRHGVFFFAAVSLSLIVGVAASMLLESLKNGFLTAEEVENHLHCPVIATILTLTNKDLTQKRRVLSLPEYVEAKPTSRTGEMMCAIRVGLQVSDAKDPPRVILFSSSVTGEGKSTVAHSFACSAVVAGLRVALIDADLRHPSLAKAFGVANERGLCDY